MSDGNYRAGCAIDRAMTARIKEIFLESAALRQKVCADPALLNTIKQACQTLLNVSKKGGTIYACGNGGSACDAMHFTEELVARYRRTRPGIKAAHFCDVGIITCWANDYDFNAVFARQVLTHCTSNDILVLFSTSGNSPSVLEAAKAAKTIPAFTLGITGSSGGQLKDLCDLTIAVPSEDTARIQEVHITLVHLFCEVLEEN